jgi:hypothetical protein
MFSARVAVASCFEIYRGQRGTIATVTSVGDRTWCGIVGARTDEVGGVRKPKGSIVDRTPGSNALACSSQHGEATYKR